MDTKQLEYFLALCQQEHISSTADFLGISQSTLSKNIASLENELGTQLFDRHKNHIRLNGYGQAFAKSAKTALRALQEGQTQIQKALYDMVGSLRIVCYVFADFLADCLFSYLDLNPKVKVSISQVKDKDERLTESVDFLLVPQKGSRFPLNDPQTWISQKLSEESYYVLISPRYREYPPEVTELSMTDLKDDWFVETTLPTYAYYVDITYRLCNSHGFHPKFSCTTEDFLTKLNFVDHGKAICILPECNLRLAKKLSPDIRTFRIRDAENPRSIYLLGRPLSQQSEVAADFWEFVQDFYGKEGK